MPSRGRLRLACFALWVAELGIGAHAGAGTNGLGSETAAPAESTNPVADSRNEPDPTTLEQYRQVIGRAVREFDAGHWAEARALFLRAHELSPSARTFRALGMTSFELRAYARAVGELRAALDDPRRPLPEDQKAQVTELLDQTLAFVGRYRIQVSPSSADIRIDGTPHPIADGVLLLDVGPHELVVRAGGYADLVRHLDVRGREDEALLLELTPKLPDTSAHESRATAATARDAPQRWAKDAVHGSKSFTWIAAGTAVALGAASTTLWLISDAKYDEQKRWCEQNGCARGDVDTSTIEATQTAHQITAVLGGIAGAAAIALFFLETDGSERTAVALGPGDLRVRGTF